MYTIVPLVIDDIWNDQNLTLDSDLPSGWRTIRDSTGTYYWHVPSGTTQWQHPSYSTEDELSVSNGLPANPLKVSVLSEVTLLLSTPLSYFCVCKDKIDYTSNTIHSSRKYTCAHFQFVFVLSWWFPCLFWQSAGADGRCESRRRLTESPMHSLSDGYIFSFYIIGKGTDHTAHNNSSCYCTSIQQCLSATHFLMQPLC